MPLHVRLERIFFGSFHGILFSTRPDTQASGAVKIVRMLVFSWALFETFRNSFGTVLETE